MYTYNAEDVRIRNLCGEYDTAYVYDTNAKLSRLLQKTTNGITTKYVYGRGLIGDPGMLSLRGTKVTVLEHFYDTLLEEYTIAFGGARNAMFRLKENWRYLLRRFQPCEKLAKRLRKTTDVAEYKAITKEIFHNIPMLDALDPDW